jgi:hypothetical protein
LSEAVSDDSETARGGRRTGSKGRTDPGDMGFHARMKMLIDRRSEVRDPES